jgi:DNA-binding NarL/FixJ family response regulator
MAPRGYHDTLAALMFKTESAFGGLAMARHARLPMFGAEDKEKMALIGPHIRRAWTIADLVERRTVERDRFAAVIEHLAAPIAIVEPDGVILHLNRAAQQLVESGDVLRAENHKLLAADRQSRAALQTLLKSGYAGQARSSVIARKSGGEVIASALPLMVTTGATDDGPTAVFFHTPDKSPQLPGETLAKLYRLTGTELRILHDLVNGASVQQMAESSGSQVSTIRFHLRNLFEKTGTTRQSELVKLALSAIPPVKAP